MRLAINNDAMAAEKLKRVAVDECGMRTLYWDAMEKVHSGICSLEEVLANVHLDEFDTRSPRSRRGSSAL